MFFETQVITARLSGGIGNQFFMIAAAYSASRRFNTKLQFVKTSAASYDIGQGCLPSKYQDTFFRNVCFVDSIPNLVVIVQNNYAYENENVFWAQVRKALSDGSNVCLSGTFQAETWFQPYKEEIKQLFCMNIPNVVKSTDECVIGVRRGDYIANAGFHNPCGMTYFTRAIEQLLQKHPVQRWYVVSDDTDKTSKAIGSL